MLMLLYEWKRGPWDEGEVGYYMQLACAIWGFLQAGQGGGRSTVVLSSRKVDNVWVGRKLLVAVSY